MFVFHFRRTQAAFIRLRSSHLGPGNVLSTHSFAHSRTFISCFFFDPHASSRAPVCLIHGVLWLTQESFIFCEYSWLYKGSDAAFSQQTGATENKRPPRMKASSKTTPTDLRISS